jgi:hypothetical protein
LTSRTIAYHARQSGIAHKFAAANLLFLLISGSPADSTTQAFHRSYGPKSALLVSAPTLQWEVWPSDGGQVTYASMVVNGERVNAGYNAKLRRLEYQPSRPFAAGSYNVQCKVLVDNRLEVKKDWSFKVTSKAISSLPDPNAAQNAGASEVQVIRRKLGLDDIYQEDRLNAASLAHSKYLTQNRRTGHYEKEGEPGFVGATPADRLEAFGFSGGSWECVSFNSGGLKQSVQDLFDAPYHRIPFLQPGRTPIGTGFDGKNFTIKFGIGSGSGVSYSPASGERNVPTTWDGNENPNPLRIHKATGAKVGYPIVFSVFDQDFPTVRVQHASLSLNGRSVPVFLNSNANDDRLDNTVFLIPVKPLAPGTTYDVEIQAEVNGKAPVRRSWSFTTAQ